MIPIQHHTFQTGPILTINGGSSSIKLALFEADHQAESGLRQILRGSIDRIGLPEALFSIAGECAEENFSRTLKGVTPQSAVEALLAWMESSKRCSSLTAIAHRIVHGGTRYHQPEKISKEMLQELRRLTLFDPNHLPMEIFLIEALERHFPTVPQIVCFDTAFHHHLPRVAQLLPIPRCYEAKGARRYGFHGLSCSFIMEELYRVAGAEEAQGKIILAHLGNGVSLTAIHHGTSIDSSMGFTPTSGVMMGTRSGDLDPALLAFLGEREQMTAAEFHEMVSKRSGLLGVSETSSDLRDLLAIEKKDFRAAEAIAFFCYQIKKTIGSFTAALHGLDSLIFTGGIGEHASSIRQRICEGLSFLGIALDEEKNRNNELLVSKREATVKVYVLPTDEELMLAKSALSFL